MLIKKLLTLTGPKRKPRDSIDRARSIDSFSKEHDKKASYRWKSKDK